jgi:hypothetical protein
MLGCCSSEDACCCCGLSGSTPCQVTCVSAATAAASTAASSSPTMARKFPLRTNSIAPRAARRIAASSIA